jgi:hypothetical protein
LRPDNALNTGKIVVDPGSAKMPLLLDCLLYRRRLLPSHLQQESPAWGQDGSTWSNQASYKVQAVLAPT